jgi:hypothetical protein
MPEDRCTFCHTDLAREEDRGGVLTTLAGPQLVCQPCRDEISRQAEDCDAEFVPTAREESRTPREAELRTRRCRHGQSLSLCPDCSDLA